MAPSLPPSFSAVKMARQRVLPFKAMNPISLPFCRLLANWVTLGNPIGALPQFSQFTSLACLSRGAPFLPIFPALPVVYFPHFIA